MPEIPVWEKIVRSVVVYLFILAAFRFTGKRQVGQLTPFDLVVLLLISNVVQNAVIGPDNSLTGGLIGAVVILVLNWVIVKITYRSRRARRRRAERVHARRPADGRGQRDQAGHRRVRPSVPEGPRRSP